MKHNLLNGTAEVSNRLPVSLNIICQVQNNIILIVDVRAYHYVYNHSRQYFTIYDMIMPGAESVSNMNITGWKEF